MNSELTVGINLFLLLFNFILVGFSLKMLTEYWKDKKK